MQTIGYIVGLSAVSLAFIILAAVWSTLGGTQ